MTRMTVEGLPGKKSYRYCLDVNIRYVSLATKGHEEKKFSDVEGCEITRICFAFCNQESESV